jgi:hypothetical protein
MSAGAWNCLYSTVTHDRRVLLTVCTANNFGIMYARKRISQNSFPNLIYIFPKSFMIFCQELQQDPKLLNSGSQGCHEKIKSAHSGFEVRIPAS